MDMCTTKQEESARTHYEDERYVYKICIYIVFLGMFYAMGGDLARRALVWKDTSSVKSSSPLSEPLPMVALGFIDDGNRDVEVCTGELGLRFHALHFSFSFSSTCPRRGR